MLPDRMEIELSRQMEQNQQTIENTRNKAMEQAGAVTKIPNVKVMTKAELVQKV